MLPAHFQLTVEARLQGSTILGGEPFALVRCSEDAAARIRAWQAGAAVGDGGALARALVAANLAQPVPPPGPLPPVTAVVPVRDRSVARLLAALDVAEVIVVDDASANGEAIRAEAEAAGARYLRRPRQGGAAAARNDGLAAASHELVACIDSDCVPRPGWLDAVLPHFADPELDAVAPRIVALHQHQRVGALRGGALPARSRADARARRSPTGACRSCPARRSSFAATIASTRPCAAARTWSSCGACRTSATSPRGRSRTTTAPVPERGSDGAPTTGGPRPGSRSATRARRARSTCRRGRPRRGPPPVRGARSPRSRSPPPRPRCSPANSATTTSPTPQEPRSNSPPLGTLRSGRVVADALTRAWWPLSAAAALAVPKARAPLAVAAARQAPAPARRRPRLRLRPLARLPRAARYRRAAPRAAVAAPAFRALVELSCRG